MPKHSQKRNHYGGGCKSHKLSGGAKNKLVKNPKDKSDGQKLAIIDVRGKKINMSCNICKQNNFRHRTAKVSTGSYGKDFLAGDLMDFFEKRSMILQCMNCYHQIWFRKGIDIVEGS